MKLLKFSAFFIFMFPAMGWSKNHALVLGGGCEYKDKNNVTYSDSSFVEGPFSYDARNERSGYYNLFRPNFDNAHQALQNQDWETTIHYDSDRWERPWPRSQPSSVKGFERQIEAWLPPNGGAQKGDQILIAINTHGSEGDHFVCAGDQYLRASEIKKQVDRLTEAGIKVAVLDTSCYSGHTVEAFKGSEVCAMSATGKYTTSEGGTLWEYIFGLGMPAGSEIPSFYVNKLPDSGNADKDGSGTTSALEAFQYAQIHGRTKVLPEINSCDIESSNFGVTLKNLKNFFRTHETWEEGVDGNPRLSKSKSRVDFLRCELTNLNRNFKDLVLFMPELNRMALTEELKTLGVPINNIEDLSKEVQNRTDTFKAKAEEHSVLASQIDSLIQKNEPVPYQLNNKLSQLSSEIYDAKKKLTQATRWASQVQCHYEMVKEDKIKSDPCQQFVLWDNRESK